MTIHPMAFAFTYSRDKVPSVEEWQRVYDSYVEMFQEDYRLREQTLSALAERDKMRELLEAKDPSDGYLDKLSLLMNQIRHVITMLEISGKSEQMNSIRRNMNSIQSEWWQHAR